jgi:hypothetical protein
VSEPFDLKHVKLSGFNTGLDRPSSIPKDENVRRVAKAFEHSIDRLLMLHFLPLMISGIAAHFTENMDRAFFEATGSLPDYSVKNDASPEVYARFRQIGAAKSKAHAEQHASLPPDKRPSTSSHPIGRRAYDLLTGPVDQASYPAFQWSIYSMVVFVFAAFESLVEDLWIVAVNHDPKRAVDEFTRTQEGQQDKSIPLKALYNVDFDIQNRFGELLVSSERYQFSSMAKSDKNYIALFGPRFDAIQKCKEHRRQHVLQLVRNVIVHQSGIADGRLMQALTEARRKPLKLTDDELGHPLVNAVTGRELQVDGEYCHALFGDTYRAANNLLRFVDKWIFQAPH